ncbi:MAG: phage neck terminator protein [Pyrinomonadaceae bacterium]
MTNEQLFALLRPIVISATGLAKCELANQGNLQGYVAPSGEYCTIWPRQSVVERGQANVKRRDIPGELIESEVRAQVIATCSVNFYRGRAHEFAEKLKQCNKHPNIQVALYKAKLGWMGTDAVNDLTALQSANWENRAQITIRLAYEVTTLTEFNNILSVAVEVQNEDAEVLAEFDVPQA